MVKSRAHSLWSKEENKSGSLKYHSRKIKLHMSNNVWMLEGSVTFNPLRGTEEKLPDACSSVFVANLVLSQVEQQTC